MRNRTKLRLVLLGTLLGLMVTTANVQAEASPGHSPRISCGFLGIRFCIRALDVYIIADRIYEELVNGGDADAYTALYAEDVLWSPPGGPEQTTLEGVRGAIQGLFDTFFIDVDAQADEVRVIGNLAYATAIIDGTLTPKDGSDRVTIKFRIVWVLERIQGQWLITRQVWNNRPQ